MVTDPASDIRQKVQQLIQLQIDTLRLVLNSWLIRSLRIWASSPYSAVMFWDREWYSQSWEDVSDDSAS
jgi:hypothetical protein